MVHRWVANPGTWLGRPISFSKTYYGVSIPVTLSLADPRLVLMTDSYSTAFPPYQLLCSQLKSPAKKGSEAGAMMPAVGSLNFVGLVYINYFQ